jgi:protein-S-isoprenylcysteine O-methyltransferase Ste14
MVYVGIATLGFVVTHLFDIVSIKRIPAGIKPLTWLVGCGLLAYSFLMVCLAPDKLPLPVWSIWPGLVLLIMSISLLIYSLFINLPFRKTYFATGVGNKLIKTGTYALVRHPGVLWFVPFMLSLILVSRSSLLLIAAPTFILLDIALVVVQDKFFFVRMFDGYKRYQRETPMLVPNRQSISAFINSLKQPRDQNLNLKEG